MKSIILYGTLFLFLLESCSQKVKSYEHELGVISNPRMYHQLAADFPDKKLVDLEKFIPGITLDIKYAKKSNFTGQRIYPSAKAFLRFPAAVALKKVQDELVQQGLGLKVFDAYRPYSATVKFYKLYPDSNFVAPPWKGSRHNRGCAVDVTLIDLASGEELEMPTPFDDFTEKASHHYNALPSRVIQNRQLLKEVMTSNGFVFYEYEWWHYDFAEWKKFGLLNISFDDLI